MHTKKMSKKAFSIVLLMSITLFAASALVFADNNDLNTDVGSAGDTKTIELSDDSGLTANEVISKYGLIHNGNGDIATTYYTLQGEDESFDSGIIVDSRNMDTPGAWGVCIATDDFSIMGLTAGMTPDDVERILSDYRIMNKDTYAVNGVMQHASYESENWSLWIVYTDGLISYIGYSVM